MQTLDAADLGSFLAAICAAPDDAITRLVFADWLQDRDDPRAEGVRRADAAGVLQILYPPDEADLTSFPTRDARGDGPRVVSFAGNVDLFPIARPIFRVNPPERAMAGFAGSIGAAVSPPTGRVVRLGVRNAAPDSGTLLEFDIAPHGQLYWQAAMIFGLLNTAIEFWAEGAGVNHVSLTAEMLSVWEA